MGIDAKPPVRRGPGAGVIVLAVVGAVLCVPLLIVGAVTLSYFFARSTRTEPVAYPTPAYYDAAMAVPSSVSPEFETRLNAANRIQMTADRDSALAVLAATFSNNTDEANRAIQGIQNSGARDEAAWNAAKRFSKVNRPQDSVKMIEMMLDQDSRDAGFRAVATGEWPERPRAATTVATEAMVTEAVEYAAESVAEETVAEEEVVTEAVEDAEETAN